MAVASRCFLGGGGGGSRGALHVFLEFGTRLSNEEPDSNWVNRCAVQGLVRSRVKMHSSCERQVLSRHRLVSPWHVHRVAKQSGHGVYQTSFDFQDRSLTKPSSRLRRYSVASLRSQEASRSVHCAPSSARAPRSSSTPRRRWRRRKYATST